MIVAIPFDLLIPAVIPKISLFRFLRLFKLVKIFALFNRFFDGLEMFIKPSNLDKIFGGVVFIILIFTLILFVFGSANNLFDDLYFVIVTLFTVGYGDVTPVTFDEKLISIFLIFAGIFVFSTITVSISSYFTDRLINVNKDFLEDKFGELLDERMGIISWEFKDFKNELEEYHKEMMN